METKQIVAIFVILGCLLVGAGLLWFWIWCIVDCCNQEKDDQNRMIWLLILILFTFVGAFLYFFIRRRERLKVEDYSLPLNSKAIISLIIGLFGFWILGIGIFTNIIGIVLGHIAKREIRQGVSRGNAIASAGLFICYLPYVLFLLLFVIGLPLAMIFGEKVN